MPPKKVLEELKRLPAVQRLKIIEAALHTIGEDLAKATPKGKSPRSQELARAAKALLPAYAKGGELTALTVLDSADVHVEG
jgi:hypothetical protein